MEKVSIITVTYNCKDRIEATIQSILSQTYSNIEYIIVDGASYDGTIDIINKYSEKISKFVSEPDHGVYDAMNKAVKFASGEWVNFMNAGDTFVESNTVEKMFSINSEGYGVVFGDTISISNGNEQIVRYQPHWWKHKLMPSCHQSIFVRRGLLLEFPFSLNYCICADVDSFVRMRRAGVLFEYKPVLVAKYDASEGISQNPQKYYQELFLVKYRSKSYAAIIYRCYMFRLFFARIGRRILSAFKVEI